MSIAVSPAQPPKARLIYHTPNPPRLGKFKNRVLNFASKADFIWVGFIASILGKITGLIIEDKVAEETMNESQRFELFANHLISFLTVLPLHFIPLFLLQKPLGTFIEKFVGNYPKKAEATKFLKGLLTMAVISLPLDHIFRPFLETKILASLLTKKVKLPDWLLKLFSFHTDQDNSAKSEPFNQVKSNLQ